MSYNDIPAGKDLPNDINVIIEIPANHDPIKYEVDKDSDAIFVDRFVATPMFYPANYGYVPQTLSEDGDPLDPGNVWSKLHTRGRGSILISTTDYPIVSMNRHVSKLLARRG